MQTRHGRIAPPVERRQHDDDSAFGRVPAFLVKTYDLVGDSDNQDIVSWEDNGQSFVIWHPAEFSRDLLPQYFKHSNLASFVRQLNTYGFQKANPDRWEFHHPNFKRAHPELLGNIPRRRTANKGHGVAEGTHDNGLAAQINALKQDKRMIMLEVLKLQQSQERSKQETEQLRGQLQRTEQVQKQLMACLTAAVQDPCILRNMLATATERGALEELPSGHGKKRQRPWSEDEEPQGQLVTRATAEAMWPSTAAQQPSVGHVPVLGSLPAEASKHAPGRGAGSKFSFVPNSDGATAAVSPFAATQAEEDSDGQHQQDVPDAQETAGPASAPPLSLKSADLMMAPKSAGADDPMWPLPSLPAEWSTRGFDVLGSQPSWTFAVGGVEAVR